MIIKIFLILSFVCLRANAQKKWAGAVTGNWEDAKSWQPPGVPATTDDVILDNNFQKNNYTLTIAGAAVNIHALSLEPAASQNIELVIASSNKNSPALTVNDSTNSFNIKSGGIIRNSSGLSSGQSIQARGLISIFNGGRYIHNSRSSHATEIVAKLSGAAGTEQGVFEFDVPGGSYPISLSNRIYGTLILSADASGGNQTYNASGANPVLINGDFQINEGVQFNLDLTNDMVINAEYIQKGGVFNLASQHDSNTVKIKGDIIQSPSSIITETSDGQPVIELCGAHKQLLSVAGNILNSISMKINNPQGVALTNALTLPYKLELTAGTVKTGKTTMLTLVDNATVSGGSVHSFIDGPLRKIGDDDFEFPVGKQGDYAPLIITGSGGTVTDEFIAEYFLGNPALVYGYNFESPPLVRISGLEYWIVERPSGLSPKKVGVYVGNYSNATALAKLMLVRWDGGANVWKSEGNTFYSGIATGRLVGNYINLFGTLTLGSTVAMQNPLPLDAARLINIPLDNSPRVTFRVFPSLVTGNVYLELQLPRDDVMTVIVRDITGRVVETCRLPLSKGFNKIPFGLDTLAKGPYVFCLYDGKGRCLGVQRISKI